MSRVAKRPIPLPAGVDIAIEGQVVAAKGPKGAMQLTLHPAVTVVREDNQLQVAPVSTAAEHRAQAGAMRALLNNMVTGVSAGFERKLQLVGVGYRAQAQGKTLNLSLGYSHPIEYSAPEGVTLETPNQTEILVKGVDRQRVGQTAAEIRAFRPPEPYKGKGVRYADETIVLKEAKKK